MLTMSNEEIFPLGGGKSRRKKRKMGRRCRMTPGLSTGRRRKGAAKDAGIGQVANCFGRGKKDEYVGEGTNM